MPEREAVLANEGCSLDSDFDFQDVAADGGVDRGVVPLTFVPALESTRGRTGLGAGRTGKGPPRDYIWGSTKSGTTMMRWAIGVPDLKTNMVDVGWVSPMSSMVR